jgi:hypothetical protein
MRERRYASQQNAQRNGTFSPNFQMKSLGECYQFIETKDSRDEKEKELNSQAGALFHQSAQC